MARAYSTSEAKRFRRIYQELYAKFRQLDSLADRCREEVKTATAKIAGEESMELLKGIPVDELNREKKGIRVKTLHDAGYHTIGDIVKANPYQLSSINGISPEGANEIKKAASAIAETAQKGAKISLSADNKTPASTALVTALFKYKRILPTIKSADEFRQYYDKYLSDALSAAKPAMGGLR